VIEIRVIGLPAPQGSKRHVGHGVMIESSKKVKPWRESVVWAAREALFAFAHSTGPVSIDLTFTLPKPKSAPKTRRSFPDRKPDIDKLCRSTLDALVTAGTIEDDARVVWMRAAKVFPNEGQDALDVPGAVIRIRAVESK
jgi:Holliday junction resolvase RusA-like endonuclease